MDRKRIGILGGLALAIAAVVSMWRMSRPPSLELDPQDAAAPSAEPAPSSGVALEVARTESEAATRSRESVESVPTPIEPSPEDGVQLLIVDRTTGTPQPRAIVTRFDSRADSFPTDADAGDFRALLDRCGRRFRADATGIVTLPPSRHTLEVYAENDEMVGYVRVAAAEMYPRGEAPPKRIEIVPWRTLRIETVDASRRPRAGIPIAIETSIGAGPLLQTEAITGGDGIVAIEGANLWFEPGAWPREVTVRTTIPQPRETSVRAEERHLDGPPVRLEVSGIGRVEITIVGPDGKLIEEDGGGSIRVLAQPPDRPAITDEGHAFSSVWVPIERGRGVIDAVATDCWLAAEEWWDPVGNVSGSARGPVVDGETTQLELTAATPPAFTGRIVDPAGSPVSGLGLVASFEFGFENNALFTEERTKLDDHGFFRLIARNGRQRTWDRASVRFAVELPDRGSILQASMEFSGDVASRGGSLGTIRTSNCPCFASGVVVDDAGMRIGRATLQLARTKESLRRLQRSGRWVPELVPGCSTRSGEDGHFSLHGTAGEGPFELRLLGGSVGSMTPLPIEPGVTGVRVVVERYAALEGRVLLDADVAPSALHVSLRLEPRKLEPSHRYESLAIDGLGRFSHSRLLPRKARLWIVATAFAREGARLVEIDGLELRPGEMNRDPRLQSIDLRGRILRTDLEVVDEQGQPAGSGIVRELRENGADFEFESGRTVLYALDAWPEVEVVAPGFGTSTVVLSAPTTRVVLRRGVEATFEFETAPGSSDLATLLAAVPAPLRLLGSLAPAQGELTPEDVGVVSRDFDGQPFVARMGDAGFYALAWYVVKPDGRGNATLVEIESARATFEVGAAADSNRFRVSVDGAAIDRAVRKAMDG